MKKTIVISLVLLSIFLFAGCTKSTTPTTTTSTTSTTTTTAAAEFTINSSAFTNGSRIPTRNACTSVDPVNALDYSIPLSWFHTPAGTFSFVITMVDTTASYTHWLVTNIPGGTTSLVENASSTGLPAGSTEVQNDLSSGQYYGPAPPAGDPAHNYVTTIYALNVASITASNYAEILAAISGHVIASANITGTFSQ